MKGRKLLGITISGGTIGVCGQNSPDVRKWYELLCHKIKSSHSGVYKEHCCVRIGFHITETRTKTNDLDNLTKPVLDALEETKVIQDDNQVFSLDVAKFPVNSLKDERVHMELWEWK